MAREISFINLVKYKSYTITSNIYNRDISFLVWKGFIRYYKIQMLEICNNVSPYSVNLYIPIALILTLEVSYLIPTVPNKKHCKI
jgi:hypothetical protein